MQVPKPEAISCELARRKHIHFMRVLWHKKTEAFKEGLHTKEICSRIDKALEDFGKGKSTYLMIKVPFRHGKSEIISKFLPTKFLAMYPEQEVLVTTYSTSLVNSFSRFARNLISDRLFKKIYPNIHLSTKVRNVNEWGLSEHIGKAQFVGMGGQVIGKGGALIIIDDFFKSREEAESENLREKRWTQVQDILTRSAPVSIVIILATPWHIDDVFGRIKDTMEKDESFPQFEELKFPAIDKEKYYDGYLFPERYSPDWYESMKASLGTYGTASLLQCDPQPRDNIRFNIEKVHFVNNIDDHKINSLQWVRAWDLASSVKQVMKYDPDYTVGVKLAVERVPTKIRNLYLSIIYIDDIIRGQWEATERNQIILQTAIADGEHVPVGIEAFAGYKDAYTEIKSILKGIRNVSRVLLPGDKLAKSSCLIPIFESGNIICKIAKWNTAFKQEFNTFPGKHDDIIDSIVVGYNMTKNILQGRKE